MSRHKHGRRVVRITIAGHTNRVGDNVLLKGQAAITGINRYEQAKLLLPNLRFVRHLKKTRVQAS
jgi:hypothetical protein